MNKSEAYQIVFDDLMQIDLFRGIYDARHGNEHYMHGISVVIEYIAQSISDECYEKFNTEFIQNMIKSEKKWTKKTTNTNITN